MRSSLLAIAVVALVATVSTGCTSACAVESTWQNAGSSACSSCTHTNCNVEENNATGLLSPCFGQFLCAGGCARGREYCQCVAACWTGNSASTCSNAFNNLQACQANNCDNACH